MLKNIEWFLFIYLLGKGDLILLFEQGIYAPSIDPGGGGVVGLDIRLCYAVNPSLINVCVNFLRRLEDILDAFADRVSKPRLYQTDKMQIALGMIERGFYICFQIV